MISMMREMTDSGRVRFRRFIICGFAVMSVVLLGCASHVQGGWDDLECGELSFDPKTHQARIADVGVNVLWSRDWSPDCGWISYEVERAGVDMVVVTSDDPMVWMGEGEDAGWRVSDIAKWSWSPDGSWIAFNDKDGLRYWSRVGRLWAWNVDEGFPSLVATDVTRWAWSPTGSSIAYSERTGVYPDRSGVLWVWPIDGELARVGYDVEEDWVWSTDGSHVTYASEGGLFDWWVDGGTSRQLASGVGRWVSSPDRSRIAYSDGDDGDDLYYGGGELWIQASADADRFEFIASDVDKWEWSPDSNGIAYSVTDEADDGKADLWVRSIDGELTHVAGDVGRRGTGWDWSPDGEWLAYNDGEFSDGNLWVLSVDGKVSERITFISGWWHDSGGWEWSPLRNWLAYRNNETLHVWSQEDEETRPVASGTYTFYWSPDGSLLAYPSAEGTFVVDVDSFLAEDRNGST